MNPPFPFPNPSSFTFLPQNLNPNPNSKYNSLTYLLPIHPPLNTTSTPTPAPLLDLPTSLSTLNHLINLSETTLASLPPSLLLHSKTLNDAVLCTCPFDPHHRVPLQALFRHSLLHCPSSSTSAPFDSSLLDSLRYPKTLKSEAGLPDRNRFDQNRHDSRADLCFALDGYAEFASNFFYRDCPSVVCSSDHDRDAQNDTFTVPGVLLAECANFTGQEEHVGFRRESMRFLPSELWAVRGEIEVWNDYPSTYSYCVLQLVSQLPMIKETDLVRWVISNSTIYGILIDVYMKDHMLLLFSLCLKAIVREAIGLVEMLMSRELKEQDSEINVRAMTFRCPILVEVLMWLASQFSVLYGEVNAKFFIVNLLKKCLLNAASELLLFSSEKYSNAIKKELERDEGSEEGIVMGQSAYSRDISVSQIAAAVAALHERSLLEGKIRGLQFSQLSTNYHRMAEHSLFSKRAHEERQKRSSYRPIIEHDGLLWHRSKNQETGKNKTREELLAEERDYKRRRMSYRGKKLKRSTTQVTRDIIEEYMEDIKRAGGIGCFVKGGENVGMFSGEKFSAHSITTDTDAPRQNICDSSETSTDRQVAYKRQSHSDYHIKARSGDVSPKDFDKWKRNSLGHDRRLEYNRSISRERHNREYYSTNPERHHGLLHESFDHRRERDAVEMTRSKHREMNQASSNSHGSRSFSSMSYSVSNSAMGKGNHDPEIKDRHRRNVHRSSRSYSVIQNSFDDRYDPSESHDIYEDDASVGCK